MKPITVEYLKEATLAYQQRVYEIMHTSTKDDRIFAASVLRAYFPVILSALDPNWSKRPEFNP